MDVAMLNLLHALYRYVPKHEYIWSIIYEPF